MNSEDMTDIPRPSLGTAKVTEVAEPSQDGRPGQAPRWVFSFESDDGRRRDLLGGKGAELAEMTSLGLPVPPGFTITTEACREYYRSGKRTPEDLWGQVQEAMEGLMASTGRNFGDPSNPLLVSVRSGAAVSMPGMMDTILNLGINREVADGIARSTHNERFARDIYRRFIQMYGSVVLGVDGGLFDQIMEEQRLKAGVKRDADLGPDLLGEAVARFKGLVEDATDAEVPDDPFIQLQRAVLAVFESWNGRRAIDYRDYYGIPHDLGTAVNVVAMVFGNMDDRSCSGVLFTRDPATGEKSLYGEYLTNAQGEDVVSGTATPQQIALLASEMPHAHQRLMEIADELERHYSDAQDVEFTVERGDVYVLQTRTAERSARAAVKIAVDMAEEGLITRRQALLRVAPEQIYQLLLPRLEESAKKMAKREGRFLAAGLGASPGGATGKVVFSAEAAAELASQGVRVVLARPETSAEDVHGMMAAAAVLTSRGGATSHAAVVARGLGSPASPGWKAWR